MQTFDIKPAKDRNILEVVHCLSWSPDGDILAAALDDSTISLWEPKSWREVGRLEGHSGAVICIAWSPDGRFLASGSSGKDVLLWDMGNRRVLRKLEAHKDEVQCLTWLIDGRTLVSGSDDKTIRVWDTETGRETIALEGHTQPVTSVSLSFDGRVLASAGVGDNIRLWRCETWETLKIFKFRSGGWVHAQLAFQPHGMVLAALDETATAFRIWDLDLSILLGNLQTGTSIHHKTAKIVLVGDSGVGKTGLGWRLARGEFKEHSSTHGQQFWVLDTLRDKRGDGTECEAVLWDLAGQPDYRLIHALFLDDAELALVLFNPTDRQDPLHGVDFWLKALSHRQGRACSSILVGARTDRGDSTLTDEEIDTFCRDRKISGSFIKTSALTGDGLADLIDRMRTQIVWDDMSATVTTTTFKRIKEFVLGLKEDPTRKDLLTDPAGLRKKLQQSNKSWEFNDHEMMTAVDHLAKHGYVRVLRTSSGEKAILLTPDLLNNLAASFVLEARRNPKGLGALDEERLLSGGYNFSELFGLSIQEQKILLDAAAVLFLQHNICFRESLGSQTFLIFPELINRKKPQMGSLEMVDDISYTISGSVENVYAALVVLLGYTNTFTRTHQWQHQAQYEMAEGEICGFRQISEREGEIDFVLNYSATTGGSTRSLFQGLFERFLSGRNLTVIRYPPLTCPSKKCSYRQDRAEVVRRILQGQKFLFCSNCGRKISLPKAGEEVVRPKEARIILDKQQATAKVRTNFEAALLQVKTYIRDRDKEAKPPSCFVSYAWGVVEHERWVQKHLAKDLLNAGIDVVLDQWHNAAVGANVPRFISLIERCDFVVAIGTKLYLEKYENKLATTGSVVAAEVDLINLRLMGSEKDKETVLPVLLEGEEENSLSPLMRGKVYADFRDDNYYFVTLFDLVLTLYHIPFDNRAISDLRDSLRRVEGD